jgi:S1/P1 Nuclease
VPLDEPRYNPKCSGPTVGRVVDKINEFRRVTKDQTKAVEERRFALRFLIHFVEDMHMPMHVGDNKDEGGNRTQVRFFDKGTNMHALWDSGMIQRVNNTEGSWLADLGQLDTPEARAAAMKGTVEDWATESLVAARQAYQVPETGMRLKPGQNLADAYLEQHGGETSFENLALACPHDNFHKGPNISGLDPETGRVMRLLSRRIFDGRLSGPTPRSATSWTRCTAAFGSAICSFRKARTETVPQASNLRPGPSLRKSRDLC